MTTSFMAAVDAERNNGHRPLPRKRTPLLVVAGRLVGRYMPRAEAVRRVVLTVGSLAAADYAAFLTDVRLGWALVAVSGLVLEWLSGDNQ